MSLSKCNINLIYKIDHIDGFEKYKLLELGFIKNFDIKVIYKLTKLGPYIVEVKNIRYGLRNEIAEKIKVMCIL